MRRAGLPDSRYRDSRSRGPESERRQAENLTAAGDTRLRDAAVRLRREAAGDVERFRSRGWTQADFATALRETLGSGEDGPA